MKTKFILYFLIVLFSLFVIQGIMFGIYMFFIVLKYLVISGIVAGVIYLFLKKKKEE
jgi:hypothetical protein